MSAAADRQNAEPSDDRPPGNRSGDDRLGDNAPPDNRLRLLVAAVVLLEATLLIGAAIILVVASFGSDQGNPAALLALAAIAVIVGGGLAVCARAVSRGLPWTRGPVLTWQLLQAGVAMPLSGSGAWWAGVPLLAGAVVVGVLIAGRHVIPYASDRF